MRNRIFLSLLVAMLVWTVVRQTHATVVLSEDFESFASHEDESIATVGGSIFTTEISGGSFTAQSESVPVYENNSTNPFTGSTYLLYADGLSVPSLRGPVSLDSTFVLSFDYYEPTAFTTGTQTAARIGLSSGDITASADNRAIEINLAADTTASTGTLTALGGSNPSTTYDAADLVHVDLYGNFGPATISYGPGNTSFIGGAAYDVYINGSLAIDDAPFRNALESVDEFGIFASGTASKRQTAFLDNIVIDDEITGSALAAPVLKVNRYTGAMTLFNYGSTTLDIQGYSIRSDYGALNPAGWKSIADNYDADSGDHSVDMNDTWTKLTNEVNVTYEDLSEFQFGGDGGHIAPGASVELSLGSGAWFPTPTEDLEMNITLGGDDNGSIVELQVVYEGNGDEMLARSDLNHDGSLDSSDWDIFRMNNGTTVNGATPALRYLQGDLDSDGDNDTFDFALFRADYIAENGVPAFAALIAGAVPEPSSLLLLGFGLVGLCLQRSWRRVSKSLPLVALPMLALFIANTAQADVLGWYRMGDDDSTLTSPPTADGQSMSATEGTLNNSFGSYPALVPTVSSGIPKYSSVTPGSAIKDPLNLSGTGLNYANDWSYWSDATEDKQRSDAGIQTMPSSFSYETFVRFDSVSASNGIDFAYQRTNGSGGWRIELLNGVFRLHLESKTPGEVIEDLAIDSTTPLVDGKWYHVGVIFDGNSNDGSPDAHLYVDYQLEASGNVPDANSYVISGRRFYNGSILGQQEVRMDETRFLDGATAADGPEDFLRVASLEARVHPVTGEVLLYNDSFDAIDLANYQINSSVGSLLAGNGNWNSLADQNPNTVGGGDDPGETWEESNSSGPMSLAESFLLGSTTIAAGESIGIGKAYDAANPDENMLITYLDLAGGGAGQAKIGAVEFLILGDMDGNRILDDNDVSPFIQALTNRSAYEAAHPGLIDADLMGDFDGNGLLDFGDVAQFSQAIANAVSGSAESSAVPEPPSALLITLATCCFACGRRRHSRRTTN